jgi:alpha-galactosidase
MLSNNSMEKNEMTAAPRPIPHLRAAGVSLVVDLSHPAPAVLHWGRDLGDVPQSTLEALRDTAETARLHNAPDSARRSAR